MSIYNTAAADQAISLHRQGPRCSALANIKTESRFHNIIHRVNKTLWVSLPCCCCLVLNYFRFVIGFRYLLFDASRIYLETVITLMETLHWSDYMCTVVHIMHMAAGYLHVYFSVYILFASCSTRICFILCCRKKSREEICLHNTALFVNSFSFANRCADMVHNAVGIFPMHVFTCSMHHITYTIYL